MTRDEARKLIGGYATGSLTETERRVLFEAALQDQELFDELAGEQVMKEVLDEPGARQRLIAVLEPPRKHRAWLWATASASVAIAVVIGIVVSQRTPPPPQQIAQVLKSPEPVNTPTAPPVAEPPTVRRKVAPGPPAPAPELQKTEAENKLADQVQQAKPQAAAGAVREFAALRAPSAFAFNYTVGADGFLEIVPAARGFLSVTAGDAVVLPSTAVNAGTPVRIAIPSDATSLVIAFSGMPEITGTPVRRDGTLGTVTDQDPPNGRILIQLFLTPATR
jgi:hypothetical protein